jgi:DNA helicase-2/ATP-dependent DNA helicase PcrA
VSNLEGFLTHNKSMIIAPAGYGKTHTIVNCVKLCKSEKKCLILTHTHAGIASIREKMKKEKVEPSKYSLETISSFTLQYTNTFHIDKSSIPNAENYKDYFNFAIETTMRILQSKPIKDVIKSSYSHLIVDEYQDCTRKQHQLILALSNILPTHILGDPLQGIFEFKDNFLVDMESDEEMAGLNQNMQKLSTPWRWNNAKAAGLGQSLSSIRTSILKQEDINLRQYMQNIELVIANEDDLFEKNSFYYSTIWHEINSHTESLLLIHPDTKNAKPRIKFIQLFPAIKLIESLDNSDFYKYSRQFDEKQGTELIESILTLMKSITRKSEIDKWFKEDNTLRNKKENSVKIIMNDLQEIIQVLLQEKNSNNIAYLIYRIFHLPKNRCYRVEFLRGILKALYSSYMTKDTIYEAMRKNRDFVRKQGRKVFGKCIGTTLLTKGLEFDTVIILNAHRFEDSKNLYVALTRACKKLIIITKEAILKPY